MARDGGGGGGYEGGGDFHNTVQELVITGQELCYPIVDVVSSHTYVVLVHSKTATKALHMLSNKGTTDLVVVNGVLFGTIRSSNVRMFIAYSHPVFPPSLGAGEERALISIRFGVGKRAQRARVLYVTSLLRSIFDPSSILIQYCFDTDSIPLGAGACRVGGAE